MKFTSEKSIVFGIVIWGSAMTLLFVSLAPVFVPASRPEGAIATIVCLLTAAFLLWLWFGTYYQVKGDKLIYRSGPFRGSIDVHQIHTLVRDKTLWVGMKPALALRGIIVRYNQYDEIYISPKEKDAFIRELLDINHEIRIISPGGNGPNAG